MTLTSKTKVFRLGGNDEDLIITAYAPVEGAADAWRQMAFKAVSIDFLYQIDDRLSGITLKNGITIPVVMSFDALRRAIYEPDMSTGNGIDLTLLTGKAVGEVQAIRLAKTFNPAAVAAAPEKTSKLEIVMFTHADQNDRKFRRIRVAHRDINYFEPNKARKETETFFQLKAGVTIEGMTNFYAAIPLDHFTAFLNNALRAGETVLDLSERTRPLNPKGMEMG
ncbi:MAG TPA: hypothetical protein VEF76_14660 [Patescibacteria group bacterium]|nr:hypothetical protein [Patescibacteria group bacterium]